MIFLRHKKFVSLFLLFSLTLPLLFSLIVPISKVTAAEVPGGNSANQMATSMIGYFRDKNNINPKGLKQAEARIWGVFLSNFFIPWSTTLESLKSDTQQAKGLSETLSKRFFGDDLAQSSVFLELNGLIHQAIYDEAVNGTFTLYPTADEAKNKGTKLSGELLLKKIASTQMRSDGANSSEKVDGSNTVEAYDPYLYLNKNGVGVKVMNLNDKATRAALKVLFGLSSEMVMSKEKGLRKMESLHLDGFGNIWGRPEGEHDYNKLVLVLPAALNPVTFGGDKSLDNNSMKFPVANTFVMGTIMHFNAGDLSNNPNKFIPYYNVAFDSQVSLSNSVSLYGVYSVSPNIANSDRLFKGYGSSLTLDDIKDFVNSETGALKSESNAVVFLDYNVKENSYFSTKAFEESNISGFTTNARQSLSQYFAESLAFRLNELADEMYYFNNPYQSLSGELEINDEMSLFSKQRLFTKAIFDESSGEYLDSFAFYNGSHASSPLMTLLSRFWTEGGYTQEAQDEFLTSNFKDRYTSLKEDPDYFNSGAHYPDPPFVRQDIRDFFNTLTFDSRFKSWETPISMPSQISYSSLLQSLAKFLSQGATTKFIGSSLLPTPLGAEKVVLKDKSKFLWVIDIPWTGKKRVVSASFTKEDSLLGQLVTDGSLVAVPSGSGASHHYFASLGTEWYFSGDLYSRYQQLEEGGMNYPPAQELRNLIAHFFIYEVFGVPNSIRGALRGVNADSEVPSYQGGDSKFKLESAIYNEVNYFVGIYWGYMVGLLGAGKENIEQELLFSNQYLPTIHINVSGGSGFRFSDAFTSAGAVASDKMTDEVLARDLLRKMYSLLSDGESQYRNNIIKATQDSWIISTHHSIVGSWVGKDFTVSAGGGNSYGSVVGFINTPSLTDLPLTAWLLKDYMLVYLCVLVVTFILCILMVAVNVRSLREGVLTFIVMAFLLFLPQFLLSGVINLTNSVSDRIFSDRFNYWAIVQHEQSVRGLSKAAETGDPIEFNIEVAAQQMTNTYGNTPSVTLKWMAPKRYDYFKKINGTSTVTKNITSNLSIFRWIFASFLTQDQFVYDDPLATYVYRSYNTIALEAKNMVKDMRDESVSKAGVLAELESKVNGFAGLPDERFAKILGKVNFTFSPEIEQRVARVAPINKGDPLWNTNGSQAEKEKVEIYRYWFLSSQDINNAIFNSSVDTGVGFSGSINNSRNRAFALITESPFYYFYSALANRQLGTNFRNDLLNENIFRVKGETGELYNNQLRDFLDLEGLFTYVIPYLQQGNDYVYRYVNKYGKNYKDMSSVIAPTMPDPSDPDYERKLQEYQEYESLMQHNTNLEKVWFLYSPWVDQLYSTSFSHGSYRAAGKSYYLDDTINPSYYEISGRPMIFSPADMHAKYFKESDLTLVEQKIQNVLKETYRDMMYLINYYDFDDDVLLTAAAMSATFNFNKEFSEIRFLGESSIQYPQGFELKNFNYDAFMRLILMNSTGEPMLSDEDLYVRVVKKTSFITGFLLLASDILNVIVVPALKMVLLFLLFIMIFIMVLNGMITPPDKVLSHVMKKIFVPVLSFMVATVVFAIIVSMIMGEGLTGYVGSRLPTIGMTDPTITLLIMIVVSLIYIFVMFVLALKFFRTIRDEGSALLGSVVGMVADASAGFLQKVTGGALRGFGRVFGFGRPSVRYKGRLKVSPEKPKRRLIRRTARWLTARFVEDQARKTDNQAGSAPSAGMTTEEIDKLASQSNQPEISAEPTSVEVPQPAVEPQPRQPAVPPFDEPARGMDFNDPYMKQMRVTRSKAGDISISMKLRSPEEFEKYLKEKEQRKVDEAARREANKQAQVASGKVKSKKRRKKKK